MKIAAKDIQFANAVFATYGGMELAGAPRLKVARLTRTIRAEAETIQGTINALSLEHIEKGTDGQPVMIETPRGQEPKLKDPKAYRDAEKKILSETVEIACEPLTLAEIGDGKGPTAILDALLPFIADPPKA